MLEGAYVRVQRAIAIGRRLAAGEPISRGSQLVDSAPSAQTAIEAVPDAWASRFPEGSGVLRAGEANLFDDARIHWAFEQLGGVKGMSVLDLGPLEGAYSYMAERAGARRVVGVEANQMAFLKCLVTKELLAMERCSFLCGEANAYLASSEEKFDLCIACGVLYHMADPLRLIDLISQSASKLVMWTHVYDDAALSNAALAQKLGPEQVCNYQGLEYRAHRHSYGVDRRMRGFWGGTAPYSTWLRRSDLFVALEHFGWGDIQVAFDEPHHPNGPALALVADRGSSDAEGAAGAATMAGERA